MMGKLVRDHIPRLFGGKIRTLAAPEYHAALRDKLREEVQEYLESGDVMELTDVLEVVYALAELDGVAAADLEGWRARKAAERGGFSARVWWEPEITPDR